jgi:histidine ammonia-lyase
MEFDKKLSDAGKDVYIKMREIVPTIRKDQALYKHIENLKQYLIKNRPNRIN